MDGRDKADNICILHAAIFDRKFRKIKSCSLDSASEVFLSKRITKQHWSKRSSIPVMHNQEYILLPLYGINNSLFSAWSPIFFEVFWFFLPTKGEHFFTQLCFSSASAYTCVTEVLYYVCHCYLFTFLPC